MHENCHKYIFRRRIIHIRQTDRHTDGHCTCPLSLTSCIRHQSDLSTPDFPDGKIQIWANFGEADPNTNLTEINARATAIFPEKSDLKFIVIDGFDVRHTAPQWGDIYTVEKGAIGTRYGYGWTIENCTITNSRNIGISLGVTDEVHFPRGDEGGLLEGGSNIPPLETTVEMLEESGLPIPIPALTESGDDNDSTSALDGLTLADNHEQE